MALSKRKRGRKSNQTVEVKRKENEEEDEKEKGEENREEAVEKIKEKVDDEKEERRDEVTVVEKSADVKGKSVTTERKTNKSLEEQVEALKKENADLRTELEQLKLVHRSEQEAREDIREERRSEQGLCSPCAAYLLRLQEQASNVDRRNQRHRKEEVDENPKVRERKKQETFSHRSMLEQEADDYRNDCADVRVAEEGRKIWKMKGEEEQEGWTTVKGRKRQNANKGEHGQISTSNRFSVLDSEMKEGKKKVGCLVVGDSRVRPLEKNIL